MSVDLLIRNGPVIDGSGAPRYQADVAITGGKIVGIGRLNEIEARFDPEQLDPFFERLRAALIREVNEKVLHFKQTVL